MRTVKMLLAFALFLCIHAALAQTRFTGRVTDSITGSPLEGVSIKIKSSKAGTTSNKDGVFSIQASSSDVLVFSYVGYTDQEVNVNDQTNIEVKLVPVITDLGQIVTVGTRNGCRIKTESPVPVDVININQAGVPTAKMDLTSVLNYAAPSFNYNKQSGADGADHIDLATLRGLGPDQTLVLVNGKRRHQTAFVAVFGTRGRGNSGTDLNALPSSAIERVEILRDGASAQYGSDAIAGVMNLILRRDVNHLAVTAGYSAYYDHKYNSRNSVQPSQYVTGNRFDGQTFTFGLNHGFSIGPNKGFLNYSLNFLSQGKTFRQVPDTNIFSNSKALPVNNVRRAMGDASVTSGGLMLNSEIPLTTKTSFYAFGGYNYKNSNAFAYSRNFTGHPERFPNDGNGNLIFVPGIMHFSGPASVSYTDPVNINP